MQLRPLTSIRFLFALLVVVFHGEDTLKQGGFDDWPFVVRAIISHGYTGVSFFFVLSGFILAYSYRSKLNNVGDSVEFWRARFARIYPAYLVAFIIFLPIAIYTAILQDDFRIAFTTAALQLTLLQSWIPSAALRWNGPAWSLSVEALFYALFPLLFLKARPLSDKTLFGIAALAYLASQIGALIGWRYGPSLATTLNDWENLPKLSNEAITLFFMYFPLFRVPEFAFGMTLGILFTRSAPVGPLMRRFMIVLGCLGFGVGFVVLGPLVPGEMIADGLLMPFLGLLLVGLAYSPSRIFNHWIFVQLGEASYSLYLLHIPLWNWMSRADDHFGHWRTLSPLLFFFAYVAFTVAASVMSLHLIEIPARSAIRRWLRSPRRLMAEGSVS
jgi:peptidoglycan/LPS O-acetylase OafA/YrhL